MFAHLFTFDRDSYAFSRILKDMYPYQPVEKDGKLYFVVNVLGVNEKDISVQVEPTEYYNEYTLKISGSTPHKIVERNFSVNVEFTLRRKPKQIEWSLADGIMTVEVAFEEPVKPQILIVKK
jgi:HSP20 family molecular chaperone IbpA